MFYLVAPVIAGLAAAAAFSLFLDGLSSPEPVRGARHRLLRAGGFLLLVCGLAAFVAAAVLPDDPGELGGAAAPFAALLVADGLLATVRIRVAGQLLVFCGVLAAPLTAVLMLLTYLFDPAGFEQSQVVPLALTVGLFTVPAILTGGMFAGAGRAPRLRGSALTVRLGAAPRGSAGWSA